MQDIQEILSVMPHRYPMLLVDRVLELDERRIRALKNVTFNEPYFLGHFPGQPVMPGVLLVEAMAQAGGYLVFHTVEDKESKLVFFSGIDGCRFRRPVVPGDQVVFEVELLSSKRNFCKLHGRATVDGELACEAGLTSALVERR